MNNRGCTMDQVAYFSDASKQAVKVKPAEDEELQRRIKQMQDHQGEQ